MVADLAAHAQAVLDAYQAVRRLPSLVAAVLDEGEPVWVGAAGAVPGPAAQTQYRIGSITKTMTGVQDGLIDLEDELGRTVPESGYRDRTLRDLLAHTSGMQSEPVGSWWERSTGIATADLITRNDGSGAVAAPGSYYHYSNLGFALLGEVVSRVRDSPWRDVLARGVLDPLRMTRTGFLPSAPAATGYSVDHFRGTLTEEPATDTAAMAPAGQLWSTVTDLARFARFLACGDSAVLDDELRLRMQMAITPDYGLATMVSGSGEELLVGHLGSMPGFQACLLIRPRTGVGAVATTNATTGFDGVELTRRLLGADTPPATAPWIPSRSVPDWAEELVGLWFWGNSAFDVRWHNDRLEFHDLARGRLAEQFTQVPDAASDVRRGRDVDTPAEERADPDGDPVGLVGVAGYHRGERLRVRRTPSGRPLALECATFVYTRTPYDPDVAIPGGHPADRRDSTE